MAKYSKGARKGVKSAMKRMERGTLRSGGSGKKVTSRKQAIAIGLSEAREKGAKVPKKKSAKKAAPKKAGAKKSAVKKSAAKKTAVKKSAVKRAAPKKSTTRKKSAVKKTTVKKSPAKKAVPSKAAPKKVAKKKSASKKSVPKKRTPLPEPTTQLRSATAEMEMPVAENSVQTGMMATDDPVRSAQRKDFDHHTSKGDPRQHLPLSSKPKGGVKPSGKKPLWN